MSNSVEYQINLVLLDLLPARPAAERYSKLNPRWIAHMTLRLSIYTY
ncbi:hypothetical protein ACFLW2_01995 [Chloroflexota bacterium]